MIIPSIVVEEKAAEYTMEDVICPFCGCCCDDIIVSVKDGRIIDVKNACILGASKFLHIDDGRLLKPKIGRFESAREVSLSEAIETVVGLLKDSCYPLLYGWACTSCEAILLGLDLAEILGGAIDNTSIVCHGPTILAGQDLGLITATLGQVKNRADLIVFWGCNPLEAHPRHIARYSVSSRGRFISGRRDRKVVVVDVRRTNTARIADLFIEVKPGYDYEVLSALKMLVKDLDLEVDEVGGIPVSKLEELADMMVEAKFGALFFGTGLTMSRGRDKNIEAAIELVRYLNFKTKFVLIPMRGHFNVTGANEAFTWRTGYPVSIDFSQGYPRYLPGETTAVDILRRGECDLFFVVASDPVSHMPRRAVEHLSNIPVITLDPKLTPTVYLSDIAIPVAYTGIEVDGSVYRMDTVPLRMRKIVDPPPGILPDTEILRMILEKVRGEYS